jgi:hypothetical protein
MIHRIISSNGRSHVFLIANCLFIISRLDRGAGKDLSLPECSRKQLESEASTGYSRNLEFDRETLQRIIYLSAQQRLNYLVKIDKEGKLRWERNDQYVDTTPGMWMDSGDGKGIVKADGKDMHHVDPKRNNSTDDLPNEEEAAKHYHGVADDKSKNPFQRIWRDRFTTNGLMERLLRKTVGKNTWMYVSVCLRNIGTSHETANILSRTRGVRLPSPARLLLTPFRQCVCRNEGDWVLSAFILHRWRLKFVLDQSAVRSFTNFLVQSPPPVS